MFHLKYKFISIIRKKSSRSIEVYKNRFTNKFYTVKKIKNNFYNPIEVDILEKMKGCSNIQQLKAIYKNFSSIRIVYEHYPGMDLFDRVKYTNFIKDKKSIYRLIISMAQCIKSCHNRGFSHNDIKMENFVFDKNCQLILIDFGHAKSFDNQHRLRILTTPYYSPPEFYNGDFNVTSDVFSLGIIYRDLLIMFKEYDPFILKMTKYNYKKRATIEEVIDHLKILKSEMLVTV